MLCSECRIGICATTKVSTTACAVWEQKVEENDFIYLCPYCLKSNGPMMSAEMRERCSVCIPNLASPVAELTVPQLQLTEPEKLVSKDLALFRYDPPVLIISIRWHENKHSFGRLLRDRLYLTYAHNEESVNIPCPHHASRDTKLAG